MGFVFIDCGLPEPLKFTTDVRSDFLLDHMGKCCSKYIETYIRQNEPEINSQLNAIECQISSFEAKDEESKSKDDQTISLKAEQKYLGDSLEAFKFFREKTKNGLDGVVLDLSDDATNKMLNLSDLESATYANSVLKTKGVYNLMRIDATEDGNAAPLISKIKLDLPMKQS